MSWLKTWWHTKVQTHLGALILTLSGIDLSVVVAYQQDIVQFFGPKYGIWVYSGLRILIGAAGFLVSVRAKQARAIPLPAPAPETLR